MRPASAASIAALPLLLLLSSPSSCSSKAGANPDASSTPNAAAMPDDTPDAAPPPPPPVELGRHSVAVMDTRKIVPSPGLPPEAPSGNSNNNLDVVRYDGTVVLAFRTSKDHYASSEAKLYVVSSTDETNWRFEARFTTGEGDLREPRFLVLGGELFFYAARLGSDPLKFQPKGISWAKRRTDGTWTELADLGKPGAIAWRTRNERGTPYMLAYLGGEHIYDFTGKPLTVELLTTRDGVSWTALPGKQTVVSRGGGSETDVAIDDEGVLHAIVRNEAGDETGFGSKICRAPASDLTAWTCKHDPRKYDSPLLFRHDGEIYLLGRRNVTETGHFDLGLPGADVPALALRYQLDYRGKPKRCSLWRLVKGENRIAYVLDLPSRGDTCFPGHIEGAAPGEHIVYNYSSDVDSREEPTWGQGQIGPTFIYRHVLRFTPR